MRDASVWDYTERSCLPRDWKMIYIRRSCGNGFSGLGESDRKIHTDASYVLDRMMSMTLGRPPGISDDDIDVSLPNVHVESVNLPSPEMRSHETQSAVHYIKLKQIESQIQRVYYTVAGRNRARTAESSQPLLNLLDRWDADIPVDSLKTSRDSLPCCSNDWFQLRGIEARLHLLRPMCSGNGETARDYLLLLARNAAKGCELQ